MNIIKKLSYFILGLLFPKGVPRKILGHRVKFPAQVSRFYNRNHEPEEIQFIQSHCFGVAIDVGAHVGLFSVLMARKAAKLIAFEPSPDSFNTLRQTISFNALANVDVRNEIVWESCEPLAFELAKSSFSVANRINLNSNQKQFRALSLDSLEIKVDFLKIDAEGAERRVLLGAKSILKSLSYMHLAIHPSILVHFDNTTQQIMSDLAPYAPKYRIKGRDVNREYIVELKEFFDLEIALNGRDFLD